jgi:hypothetical protein
VIDSTSIGLSYLDDRGAEIEIEASPALSRPIEMWIDRAQMSSSSSNSNEPLPPFEFYNLSSLHLHRNYTGYLMVSFDLRGNSADASLYINIKPDSSKSSNSSASLGYVVLLRFGAHALYDQRHGALYDLAKLMCPFGECLSLF